MWTGNVTPEARIRPIHSAMALGLKLICVVMYDAYRCFSSRTSSSLSWEIFGWPSG
jgi:hypothetical protein